MSVAKVPCLHGAFGLGQAPKKNLQAYIYAIIIESPGRLCAASLVGYYKILLGIHFCRLALDKNFLFGYIT